MTLADAEWAHSSFSFRWMFVWKWCWWREDWYDRIDNLVETNQWGNRRLYHIQWGWFGNRLWGSCLLENIRFFLWSFGSMGWSMECRIARTKGFYWWEECRNCIDRGYVRSFCLARLILLKVWESGAILIFQSLECL